MLSVRAVLTGVRGLGEMTEHVELEIEEENWALFGLLLYFLSLLALHIMQALRPWTTNSL